MVILGRRCKIKLSTNRDLFTKNAAKEENFYQKTHKARHIIWRMNTVLITKTYTYKYKHKNITTMKKAFLMLSVALLSLTACHHNDDFDFLVGEQAIGLEFYYDQVRYENTTVQRQFDQILTGKQDAMETAFVRAVNDEIDDVMLRAYHINTTSTQTPTENYIFQVYPMEITEHGVRNADVHVLDKHGREVYAFTIQTHCELDYSFTERVFESMEELGERLGKNIRYGM